MTNTINQNIYKYRYTKDDIQNKTYNEIKILLENVMSRTDISNEIKIKETLNYINTFLLTNQNDIHTQNEWFEKKVGKSFFGFSYEVFYPYFIDMINDKNYSFFDNINNNLFLHFIGIPNTDIKNVIKTNLYHHYDKDPLNYFIDNIFTKDKDKISIINNINIINILIDNSVLSINDNNAKYLFDKLKEYLVEYNELEHNQIVFMNNILSYYKINEYFHKNLKNEDFNYQEKLSNILNIKVKRNIIQHIIKKFTLLLNNKSINNNEKNLGYILSEENYNEYIKLKKESHINNENVIFFDLINLLKSIDRHLFDKKDELVKTLNIRENVISLLTDYKDQLNVESKNFIFNTTYNNIKTLNDSFNQLSTNKSLSTKEKGFALSINILDEINNSISSLKNDLIMDNDKEILINLKTQTKLLNLNR